MLEKFLAATMAALVCAIVLWLLRQLMLTPVRAGKNTAQQIVLSVKGDEPALEQHVAGLLWLNDNGLLRGRILILGYGLSEETRLVAQALERDHDCVLFCENGEAPEWIRKTNS